MGFAKDVNFIIVLFLIIFFFTPAIVVIATIQFLFYINPGLTAAFDRDFVQLVTVYVCLVLPILLVFFSLVFAYVAKLHKDRPIYHNQIVNLKSGEYKELDSGTYTPMAPHEITKKLESFE